MVPGCSYFSQTNNAKEYSFVIFGSLAILVSV
jgi:hypothetical protein